MAQLVDISTAKRHLRLSASSSDDADIDEKLRQAQEIVLGYISRSTDTDWTATIDAWTDETVPRQIRAAILAQFGELWRFRGNDEAQDLPKREHGYLSPFVSAILHRFRDPTLA